VENRGWKGVLSSIRDIKGETVIQQNLHLLRAKAREEKPPPPPDEQQGNGCIVVYFIGGVCYGELAAIRWLSQTYNREIIVCTTNITSSSRIIKSMVNQDIEKEISDPSSGIQ
jgi:hypothetical protein